MGISACELQFLSTEMVVSIMEMDISRSVWRLFLVDTAISLLEMYISILEMTFS